MQVFLLILLALKMNKSSIQIDVALDSQKVPEQITWSASDSVAAAVQKAKAMCVAFWDGQDKTAMRIDLWTKDMMVDEMADFYHQIFITMADTFQRSTKLEELSADMKQFARTFLDKFKATQLQQQR